MVFVDMISFPFAGQMGLLMLETGLLEHHNFRHSFVNPRGGPASTQPNIDS
jgi:hypothetical protein